MKEQLLEGLEKVGKALGVVLLTIILVGFIAILEGIPVYFIWNWLMPEIFGLTKITFTQAVGIAFLCRLLFSSNSSNSEN